MKYAHKSGVGSSLKTYMQKFFDHNPKKFGGENLKFCGPSTDPPSIGSA